MERIVVAGISGAGKSTLAGRLATAFDLPYVELDALFHGAGWQPRVDFEADVDAFVATSRWVVDSGGYPAVRDRIWERADTVVWLDYPRSLVMRRVIRRSVVRAVTRRPMWNGNREDPRTWLRADHPMRWAWEQYDSKREMVEQLLADPRLGHLDAVRLESPAETERWFRSQAG